ncbi:PDZ/DHR/GLGF domain-containing protein [Arthrobacter crystallopoietes BAB-32]|uniref:PDZ/DHR/GLGF domain-containing protein n=1 Tax=Arthrobacter crystallopoietes BAB-32 TaxID=1246476 RepID=N1UPU8_9MICC|nr:trypsin-like peptidase domain-containing protein [Arthrobacter crystallopoietes]EMY32416.1 PDZ/DHR/GLGF domain-containing protein [Arthrobacter crystallopoietes BAB-32]
MDLAPRKPLPKWRRTAAAVFGVVLLAGCTAPATEQENPAPPSSPTESAPATAPSAEGELIPDIVESVQPSVVTIFAGEGLGSGVIYDDGGLILTNEHVVRGADEVEVGFADGKRSAGTVRAVDRVTDLALVEVERTGLPAAEFETALPRVGELAVVIGSPLGFANTATAGIISGLHREIPGSATNSQSLVDLIQTDAAISPGNSGGALVDRNGKVMGISEAYIPPQAGAVSLGFAIPAATAVQVAEELLEDGVADHAYLGLVPAAITEPIAAQLGLPDTRGALVLSVVDGGPADDAGIRPGDVIVSIGDDAVETPEDLLAALRGHEPGESVPVGLSRGGESVEAEITLADRPVDQ